ncbi:glypican-5 [Caerostris extrusa]|uniref:Glypican-5 n=1 Tax=Caerostris extrusa TaxID=172846 RepID=A0AAV4RKE0_CAEEX|nr:glypican-5 [Caerostris extrusa]
MIQVAENSTNALFLDVYQSIEAQARVPLGQVYADLLAYMSGKDVDLEERVNSFFDTLFPVAYHHAVNMNQKDFSESFKECLRDGRVEVRPFGDLSDKIGAQVTRSFEAARTFLEALQLGLEVINTTEHMDFGPDCSEAFVRLMYCPQCQGFLQVKPCAGLCLNVVRGCLASVSELDDSWSEYVSALERLTSGMVGTYNIEHVLSTLDTKISETVSYLMANSAEISKRKFPNFYFNFTFRDYVPLVWLHLLPQYKHPRFASGVVAQDKVGIVGKKHPE